jgi:hypothetical protein
MIWAAPMDAISREIPSVEMPPDRDDIGDNPYQSPEVEETSPLEALPSAPTSYRDAKIQTLIGMAVVYAVSGLFAGLLPEESPVQLIVDLATFVLFAVLLLKWCTLDRVERQIEAWPMFPVLLIICPGPLIIMPLYFCSTRGWAGLIATGKAALFLVLLFLVAVVGAVVGAMLTGDAALLLEDG